MVKHSVIFKAKTLITQLEANIETPCSTIPHLNSAIPIVLLEINILAQQAG